MTIDRYSNVKIARDSVTKVRNYQTVLFPKPPVSNTDVYIVTRIGDRLDLLANRFYGDSTLWWIIGSANDLTDSLSVPPGTKLRIPNDVGFIFDYIKNTNESR